MSTKIEIDNETLKSVVSEAIFASFSSEQKENMIKAALSHLMTPQTNTYNHRSISPIQQAFNESLDRVARSIALELLEKDDAVKAQINSLIIEAMEKVTTANRESVVIKIANAIAEGIAGKGY
jgi:hypothetical protein